MTGNQAESARPAQLHGVWAKWDRAVEQLKALSDEVLEFGRQPHAWTIISHAGADRGHYVFRLQPAWRAAVPLRWGAVIGEIVHDFRSALDQLVWQLVRLNGQTPDRGHSFPTYPCEPKDGFAWVARDRGHDRRRRPRHGPLHGVGDTALALIERCQPYHGGDAAILAELHARWNTDKHQTLVPTLLVFEAPAVRLQNALLVDRVPDRFDGDAYVVEVTVSPGEPPPVPRVDVEPHTPVDIAFADGRAVIEELRKTGEFILLGILLPAGELFPGLRGVGAV